MKFDRGTVETRRKLKADPIFSMVKAGKLGRNHVTAVESIDSGFRLAVDGYGNVRVHVVEYIGKEYHQGDPHITKVTLERMYKRWVRRLKHKGIPSDQVINMVVFREPPHDIDRANKQRNGTASNHLMNALDLYCSMRGWH